MTKTTKTLQKVIGLVVFGMALTLTGSVAHATESGGNQQAIVEGNCPRQCDKQDGCAICRTKETLYKYSVDGKVTAAYNYTLYENTGSGSHPDCLDCDGDCQENAVTYYFTNNDCLLTIVFADGVIAHETRQCQVKWAIPTGANCPGYI